MRPDLSYFHYTGNFGLAEVGRTNALALQWAGYLVARMGASERGPDCGCEADGKVVIHHWHPVHTQDFSSFFEDRRDNLQLRIAYWAWECERSWHGGMLANAQHFDQIWTPSEYCARELRSLGRPVHVVKHAVRVPQNARLRRRGSTFRVLASFDAWSRFMRKNPGAVIRAFQEAFPMSRYRNVELVVKTLHLHDEINDDILRGKVAELMEQIEKDDRITVMDTVLTEHDMQQLIMECDAFISLHRSEGFGLNLARAIASGIPLVATDYSGNAEWMEHSWRVDWRPEQLKEHDYYPKGSWWAEPDIECAAKYLREIHDKPKKARKRAERARLAHDFSLDTLAFRMRELLSQSGFMPTRTGLPGAASIHSHPRT